jgi:hypothetical protein
MAKDGDNYARWPTLLYFLTPLWKKQNVRCTPEKHCSHIFPDIAEQWIDKLVAQLEKGEKFEVTKTFSQLTMSITMTTLFGKHFNFDDADYR